MPERSDAPLADEPQPGAIPDDQATGETMAGGGSAPTGLPDGASEEDVPLGPEEPRPEGEGEPARGTDAQPGINRGEPDSAG